MKFLLFLLFSLRLCGNLTLEEKVGQLLMVHFNGEEINEDAIFLTEELKVGSFIYYQWANHLKNPAQIKTLSENLQKRAKIPLLIAIDHEGGAVTRFEEGFTQFPGNRALGVVKNLEWAKESAFVMGVELIDVGINLNLAPVVDIVCDAPSAIGIRSFGKSPSEVISLAGKMIEGFHEAGVLTTLKHFPGLGELEADPHDQLSISKQSFEALLPYRALCSQSDMVMTAHLLCPAFDEKNPATHSAKILKDLLRKEIGFEGVIISDSLIMEGLLQTSSSIEEASILAFEAGCDILLLGGKLLNEEWAGRELKTEDVKKIHSSLCEAFKSGRLKMEELDRSVARILKAKEKIKRRDNKTYHSNNQELANKISKAALQVIKKADPLKGKKVTFIFPAELVEQIPKLNLYGEKAVYLNDQIEKTDYFVVFSYNAWQRREQRERIMRILEGQIPTIVICARDPDDADLFSNCEGMTLTLSPTLPSLQAAIDLCFIVD